MNEQTYSARLIKLEDFLRSNPNDEWKWSEVYNVLSVTQEERPAFRRRVARDWQAGHLTWLQMSVQRGRGGIGGLRLSNETDNTEGRVKHPLLVLWERVTGEKRTITCSTVKRLVEATVAGGFAKGIKASELKETGRAKA